MEHIRFWLSRFALTDLPDPYALSRVHTYLLADMYALAAIFFTYFGMRIAGLARQDPDLSVLAFDVVAVSVFFRDCGQLSMVWPALA